MIVHSRAPGRVNLIGDHTDYTGGRVFPMAIDRWTEVIGERSTHTRLVSASEAEPVFVRHDFASNPADESPSWGRYVAAVAAEIARRSGRVMGVSGDVRSDIPIGAGLSSSASLELALALAMGFDGSAQELAELGRRAEHGATGVPTGIMDQLCIAAARAGCATRIDCHTLDIAHVPMPDDVRIVVRFVAHRTLEGSGYGERVGECERAERAIGPLRVAHLDDVSQIVDPTVRRRARHVISENARVDLFADALTSGDYAAAGEIMIASHRSLSDDFAVSTPTMDDAVASYTRTPGVFGARMTGGGFGGCIVALCDADADVDGWVVNAVSGAQVVLSE